LINIKKDAILFFAFFLLYGCSENQISDSKEDVETKSPIDDPVNITEVEAIEITLQRAMADGYDSPTLHSAKIAIVYSIKYDRDIKVYDVLISTPEKLFATYNYVSTEKGELIETTH